jgi:hypothetical protein
LDPQRRIVDEPALDDDGHVDRCRGILGGLVVDHHLRILPIAGHRHEEDFARALFAEGRRRRRYGARVVAIMVVVAELLAVRGIVFENGRIAENRIRRLDVAALEQLSNDLVAARNPGRDDVAVLVVAQEQVAHAGKPSHGAIHGLADVERYALEDLLGVGGWPRRS